MFIFLRVESAAIWSLLAGYLLLPSATTIDVPLLPPLDKNSIPAATTFLLCLMKGTDSPPPRRPWLIYVCVLGFIVTPIFTSLNNSYELHIGDRSIPGFYPLDAVKLALDNLVTVAPLFVGMRFLSSDEGRALLLKSLPLAALFYSLPMLFEVRFSPQLHNWVYGFFPHSFGQTFRAGGFRPVVFLNQGLEVALFASMSCIAAVVATRSRLKIFHAPAGAVAAYLAVVLLLCKTLGSIVYSVAMAPLVLFTRPRTWVRISCIILVIVCAYPMLRTYDLVPVKQIAATANTVSADRSGSFAVRVENEDKLLAKAELKPYFGWGTWGRNRIFDQDSGKDVSITDGAWIIRFGMFGWLGYLSLFGMLATAVFSARAGVAGPATRSTIVLGGLTLILAVNVTDLIPNATLMPVTFLMAGSIAGRVRASGRVPRNQTRAARSNAQTSLAVSR